MQERIKYESSPIIDLEKGIVRAYINKFNVIDSDNEISLPGSFAKTFRERLKKMWWLLNHDWDKNLGITLALEEDTAGAIATGKFNLEKPIARDTYNDYLLFAENGRTLQHSVRVVPVKYVIEKANDKDLMKVSEWKMSEWSTLTRPGAIEDTPMISIKAETDEQITLLRNALKLNYTDEKLKAIEEKLNTLIKAAGETTVESEPNNKEAIDQAIKFINNLNF